MRTCTVCKHSKRQQIDSAIIANESLRDIAGRFTVSKSAVDRHRAHITALVEADVTNRAKTVTTDIQRAEDRVENLYTVAENVLKAAVSARDPRAALQAIRTAVGVLAEARALQELRGIQKSQADPREMSIDAEIEVWLAKRDARMRAEIMAELQTGGLAIQ